MEGKYNFKSYRNKNEDDDDDAKSDTEGLVGHHFLATMPPLEDDDDNASHVVTYTGGVDALRATLPPLDRGVEAVSFEECIHAHGTAVFMHRVNNDRFLCGLMPDVIWCIVASYALLDNVLDMTHALQMALERRSVVVQGIAPPWFMQHVALQRVSVPISFRGADDNVRVRSSPFYAYRGPHKRLYPRPAQKRWRNARHYLDVAHELKLRQELRDAAMAQGGALGPVYGIHPGSDECNWSVGLIRITGGGAGRRIFLMMQAFDAHFYDRCYFVRVASCSDHLGHVPAARWQRTGFAWMASASAQRRILSGEYQDDLARIGRTCPVTKTKKHKRANRLSAAESDFSVACTRV